MQGKVALVTGAASGIGNAVAESLLRNGAEVIAVDRNPAVRESLERARAVVCDITLPEARVDLIAQMGKVDFLVNAAGIARSIPINLVGEDDWDAIMNVNAKATFFLTQAVIGKMNSGSAVVSVASTAGKLANTTEGAPYAASKAAVIAMTKTFAYAYAGLGVRVNCVCPGITTTPMLQGLFHQMAEIRQTTPEELEAEYHRVIPLGRTGTSDEIARVIMFLLSDGAAYVTGQAINVCGGLVMC